jgi:flagellar biosynthesis/type III secretory pathway protein FliH
MNNDYLLNTLRLAGEAAAAAYKDGYRKGKSDGYHEGIEAALNIMQEKFGPLGTKSLLKAVPNG